MLVERRCILEPFYHSTTENIVVEPPIPGKDWGQVWYVGKIPFNVGYPRPEMLLLSSLHLQIHFTALLSSLFDVKTFLVVVVGLASMLSMHFVKTWTRTSLDHKAPSWPFK
jgi:hypothetical protein